MLPGRGHRGPAGRRRPQEGRPSRSSSGSTLRPPATSLVRDPGRGACAGRPRPRSTRGTPPKPGQGGHRLRPGLGPADADGARVLRSRRRRRQAPGPARRGGPARLLTIQPARFLGLD
ncbi:MAG: hypothetical protein MZV64_11755 [Ignavibacteriales bacterium]|nr:hypothetical protein [Ignavibacteriales bacterium]